MPSIEEAMKYARDHDLTLKTAHAVLSRKALIAQLEEITALTYSGMTTRHLSLGPTKTRAE